MLKGQPLDKMMKEDLERCETFISDPSDVNSGRSLYVEITAKYDSIILDLGKGLYCYYEKQGYYDPNISSDSLIHNFTIIVGRMKTYLAINYPTDNTQDQETGDKTMQERIIFLSHKSDDKKYGNALRDFIIGLGVKDEQLIYTSHPLNKIPMDENIYDYLRKHINSQVFMIILWSDKYLESPACLNEMGAAWVTQADYTNIYVPDFSFGSKYHECAVDTSKMGAVLNGDAICKASMIELKNKIIKLFDLEDNEAKNSCLLDQFMESIKGERYEIIDGGTFGDD